MSDHEQEWCEGCGAADGWELRQLVKPEEGQMRLCSACWEEYRKLRGIAAEGAQEARRVAVNHSRLREDGIGRQGA